MEWAGTLHLSWWELREFLRHIPQDRSSAFYRALRPDDWMWDMDRILAAETATALSDLRWIEASSRVGEEDMPERWAMRVFGPPEPESGAEPEAPGKRTAEEKRAIAQRARMKAVGAA